MIDRSTPNFSEFDPMVIPFQRKVLDDIHNNLDFTLGTHELLFSGSVGSAKSILAAHIICGHCFKYKNARVLIGRRSLPDLKKTLFQKLIEHLEDMPTMILGKDYFVTETTAMIRFKNGSEIISGSWADKRYLKFRSVELSMAVIEEAVENTGDDYKAINEIRQRVGRLPHIKQNMILYCTNPASPAHELYKYFFNNRQSSTRHIYFSLTEQNPFLPKTYVEQLKRDLPPAEARRMLFGEWIEIDKERLYYAYTTETNFKNTVYNINFNLSVSIAFDFNIGNGKPLSAAISQYDLSKDTFHFFDEVVVHGFRTEDALEEMAARGIFDWPVHFEIHGDATGKARSTNSQHSNYEIIENFLANYKSKSGLKLSFSMEIARSNPSIRDRHNMVNAYCKNALGQIRLFVYAKCKVLDEGMKLTALKKGAEYIEDDSKEYQHITTAAGYRIVYTHNNKSSVKGGNFG